MRADDLRSLRDRVLAATGGDTSLDRDIVMALDPNGVVQQALTGSLDAAVALCECAVPDHDELALLKQAIEMEDHEAWLHLSLPEWLPLALVAACLSAQIAEMETGNG